MQLQPKTPLTLRLVDNPSGPAYTSYVIGPSRWGLGVSIPLHLHQPAPLPVSTKLVASYKSPSGKPVEFNTYVLGYQQTDPPSMVLAQPTTLAETDRREFLRLPAKLPTEYVLEGSRFGPEKTHSLDVSVGGVCLVTGKELPAGTLMTMTLELPDGPLNVAARATWSGMRGRHRVVGIEFCNVSRTVENRLFQYVRDLERSLRKMGEA